MKTFLFAAAALVLASASAGAQDYPSRTIHFVAPSPPASTQDLVGRIIAERLAPKIGQAVVVDNKPGGSTNIGAEFVATQRPDGYTLLVHHTSFSINQYLFKSLPFKPFEDLVPVIGLSNSPTIIYVNPKFPVSSLKELVELGKAKPGTINYSTSGVGTIHQLGIETISRQTGAKFVHVAYAGGAPAVTAVSMGEAQFGMLTLGSVLPQMSAGSVRGLAIVGDKRSALAPDVPTLVEQGFQSLPAATQLMLMAPAKTPQPVIDLLAAKVREILADPAVGKLFANVGVEPSPMSGAELTALMHREVDAWKPIIEALNLHLD